MYAPPYRTDVAGWLALAAALLLCLMAALLPLMALGQGECRGKDVQHFFDHLAEWFGPGTEDRAR
ncbi:hypothetical protein EDM80_08200 [bacterium]|nr:MAG: hypothetical protein EDM80_08200 [bacterium]RIK60802.1 MAG: hypothetical protein DCC64_14125 [Planctomycetota bacterium]